MCSKSGSGSVRTCHELGTMNGYHRSSICGCYLDDEYAVHSRSTQVTISLVDTNLLPHHDDLSDSTITAATLLVVPYRFLPSWPHSQLHDTSAVNLRRARVSLA